MCHQVINAAGKGSCDPETCSRQCSNAMNREGTGSCTQTFANRFTCICTAPCS
ncbi:hypothetical protein LINPERHAP1_LOCUS12329 [Linum perenne]